MCHAITIFLRLTILRQTSWCSCCIDYALWSLLSYLEDETSAPPPSPPETSYGRYEVLSYTNQYTSGEECIEKNLKKLRHFPICPLARNSKPATVSVLVHKASFAIALQTVHMVQSYSTGVSFKKDINSTNDLNMEWIMVAKVSLCSVLDLSFFWKMVLEYSLIYRLDVPYVN